MEYLTDKNFFSNIPGSSEVDFPDHRTDLEWYGAAMRSGMSVKTRQKHMLLAIPQVLSSHNNEPRNIRQQVADQFQSYYLGFHYVEKWRIAWASKLKKRALKKKDGSLAVHFTRQRDREAIVDRLSDSSFSPIKVDLLLGALFSSTEVQEVPAVWKKWERQNSGNSRAEDRIRRVHSVNRGHFVDALGHCMQFCCTIPERPKTPSLFKLSERDIWTAPYCRLETDLHRCACEMEHTEEYEFMMHAAFDMYAAWRSRLLEMHTAIENELQPLVEKELLNAQDAYSEVGIYARMNYSRIMGNYTPQWKYNEEKYVRMHECQCLARDVAEFAELVKCQAAKEKHTELINGIWKHWCTWESRAEGCGCHETESEQWMRQWADEELEKFL